jgi:hypothetical protein
MPAKEFDAFTRLDASDVNAYLANKSISNAIINGAFEINQRGFTSSTAAGYGFDRWTWNQSGATGTYSSQAFTPGAAPLAGYEATNFARLAITTGNDFTNIAQRIEDVRSFANQTITVSFFAKGTNPTTENGLNAVVTQLFGSGGSAAVLTILPKFTLTDSWQRFSFTTDIASVSGKTIGAGSSLNIAIGQGSSTSTDSFTLDIWGVQVEAGTVANDFRRNANSIQGELAACQRYYIRYSGVGTFTKYALGYSTSTTNGAFYFQFPVEMRIAPSSVDFSTLGVIIEGIATFAVSAVTLQSNSGNKTGGVNATTTGLTSGRPYEIGNNNSTAGFIGFSAEL